MEQKTFERAQELQKQKQDAETKLNQLNSSKNIAIERDPGVISYRIRDNEPGFLAIKAFEEDRLKKLIKNINSEFNDLRDGNVQTSPPIEKPIEEVKK